MDAFAMIAGGFYAFGAGAAMAVFSWNVDGGDGCFAWIGAIFTFVAGVLGVVIGIYLFASGVVEALPA